MDKPSSRVRLSAIVESSNDAIIGKTLDGTITSWNRAAEDLYGYSAKEAIGRNIAIILPPGMADDITPILEKIRLGKQVEHYETSRKRKDNKVISVSLTVSPIRSGSGRIIGASTIARNITQQKIDADTQTAMLNLLDDLNAEKDKLEDALSKLWKLNKMEETILNLGHELKSPLVPVKSQLELLLNGDFGSVNPEQKKSLEMVLRNVDKVNHLVGNVTDIAKIESDAITLAYEPISLKQIIRDQVSDLKPKIQEKGIGVVVKPIDMPRIPADYHRITQVITNLLENAIKFTPAKGKVVIEAKMAKDMALVRVSDSGIGIRKEIIGKLFVRFFQVDSSISRKYGGTGLGLSICKGIIEAHGGKIWAESKGEGKGSTFIFTIPIKPHPRQKAQHG